MTRIQTAIPAHGVPFEGYFLLLSSRVIGPRGKSQLVPINTRSSTALHCTQRQILLLCWRHCYPHGAVARRLHTITLTVRKHLKSTRTPTQISFIRIASMYYWPHKRHKKHINNTLALLLLDDNDKMDLTF